jgi:hypothetical protein
MLKAAEGINGTGLVGALKLHLTREAGFSELCAHYALRITHDGQDGTLTCNINEF